MPSLFRPIGAVVLAAAALCLTGCVKYLHILRVNPDGSGKIELTIGVGQRFLAMLPPEQDPFEDFAVPALLGRESNGFVAFSDRTIEEADGYQIMRITMYFEDINEVRLADGDEDEALRDVEPTVYRYDPDGSLTILRPIAARVAREWTRDSLDLSDPDTRSFAENNLPGMEFLEQVVVPGEVTAAGYLMAEEDGSAAFRLSAEQVLDPEVDIVQRLAETEEVVVAFEPAGWARGAEAAWGQELAAAKTRWEQIKEEATEATP